MRIFSGGRKAAVAGREPSVACEQGVAAPIALAHHTKCPHGKRAKLRKCGGRLFSKRIKGLHRVGPTNSYVGLRSHNLPGPRPPFAR
jgi:hypothetical protein